MEIGRSPPGGAPAEMFRALADPTRRVLLERLVARPASAGDLARDLSLPRVNVSHHLGVLAAAGLIDLRRRQASIRPDGLRRLRRYFDTALTSAAITSPGGRSAVSKSTQK